jgi:uncharacterized membrane protein
VRMPAQTAFCMTFYFLIPVVVSAVVACSHALVNVHFFFHHQKIVERIWSDYHKSHLLVTGTAHSKTAPRYLMGVVQPDRRHTCREYFIDLFKTNSHWPLRSVEIISHTGRSQITPSVAMPVC